MNTHDEIRAAATAARIMAMLCVRDTRLEALHAGSIPTTRTGDYSDVFVVDAEGRRIPWTEVSRIDDSEMCELMRDFVSRLYTFQLKGNDPVLQLQIARWMGIGRKWDEPEIDQRMLSYRSE